MKTVAVIVQDGFAPFEFGLACEAFGLDRTDDGIPNFDFRIVAAEPGLIRSNLSFSITVEHDLSFADEADLVVVTPVPRASWGSVDPRVAGVIRRAVARDAYCSQSGTYQSRIRRRFSASRTTRKRTPCRLPPVGA